MSKYDIRTNPLTWYSHGTVEGPGELKRTFGIALTYIALVPAEPLS